MPLHPDLTGSNVHVIHAYTYADSTARLAASGFASADEGRCAYQQSDRTLWVLTRASPVEWKEITAGGGGLPLHASTHQDGGADELAVESLPTASNNTAHVLKPDGSGGVTFGAPPAPNTHASSHSTGGSDPVSVLNLAAGSNDTSKFFRPDGSGGIELATPAGGGGFDIRDVIVADHFLLGAFASGSFGSADWRLSVSGTGAAVSQAPEAGHPGVARLEGGTAAAGRASVYLGDSAAGGSMLIGGNAITFEVLVKFTGLLLATDLELAQVGLGLEWTATGELLSGLYVRVVGGLTPKFELVAATAGVRTVATGTTTVLINKWYRVGFVWTPGGAGAQLKVNGANEGSAVTTNIPAAAVGVGFKIDGAGGTEPNLLVDYVTLTQVTAKEDP